MVRNILPGGTTSRERVPRQAQMSMQVLIDQVVEPMWKKEAIYLVHPKGSQFLSNLFLVPENGWWNRPATIMRTLNSFILYSHFQMEGLYLLKNLLREDNFMCKMGSKDTYLCVSLHKNHQIFLRFQSKG